MKNFTKKTEQQYLELSCNLEELEKIKECIFRLPVDMGMKKKKKERGRKGEGGTAQMKGEGWCDGGFGDEWKKRY